MVSGGVRARGAISGGLARFRVKGGVARNVAVLAGSTAVGQLLVVAASPALTRLYTPDSFGILAAYIAVVTVLAPVANGRFDLAVPLPAEDQRAADVLGAALLTAVVTALLVAVAALTLGPALALRAGRPELAGYLWLVPLGLFGAAVYQAAAAWAVRLREFGSIARTRLSQSVLMTAVQLGGGVLGLGTVALLVGDALGRAGGSLALARTAWARDRVVLAGVRWPGVRAAVSRYRRFPLVSSGSAFLNVLGLQLPLVLFAVLYGPHVAGLLALGQRVIGMPSRLVGQAIGQVYLGEAARLARSDPEGMERLFWRTSARLAMLGALPIALVGLVAPWAFGWVFGAEWVQAGSYVRWLTPMFAAQFVLSPVSQSAAILERQGIQLASDALRTVMVAAAIVVPWWSGQPAATTVAWYAAAMFVSYLYYFEMYRRLVREAGLSPAVAGTDPVDA